MKKAYELSVLTGTQVLLLVVSETGLVYTFTTPKLQPLVTRPEGKNLIQACLNAPEDPSNEEEEQEAPPQPPAPQPQPQQQQPPQPQGMVAPPQPAPQGQQYGVAPGMGNNYMPGAPQDSYYNMGYNGNGGYN
ncbi:unnamed protein product [Ambrosiozyma monospora]|uniref:Unnamed protein product n=1 Tax=Ambrosiozyma monospora TaxID=43982 RepID=A0ACB5TVY9_AMBMO|nr:unnamed protein product [Ambrosiozyma monospora]